MARPHGHHNGASTADACSSPRRPSKTGAAAAAARRTTRHRNPSDSYTLVKSAWPEMMMPTMTPKRPSADAKISTTRILTNSVLLSASASAHELPTMPTQILHRTEPVGTCQAQHGTENTSFSNSVSRLGHGWHDATSGGVRGALRLMTGATCASGCFTAIVCASSSSAGTERASRGRWMQWTLDGLQTLAMHWLGVQMGTSLSPDGYYPVAVIPIHNR